MKFIPVLLLAIAALRGQSVSGFGDITSTRFDGCNTTTCYASGVCMSTLAYCFKAGDANVPVLHGMDPKPVTAKDITFHAGLLVSTICGTDNRNPSPNIDLIQVSCIDYERLRAQAPQFPWPVGKVTQVLVHVKEGDAVRITVDGVEKFAPIVADPAFNRRLALVQFDGVDYTAVRVRVYRAVEE